MKLLIDMNLTPRWVETLATMGIAAVHWSSLGPKDATDTTIMAYAADHDMIVFTHDLDFSAILASSGDNKPSVVQVRGDDISPETLSAILASALREAREDLDRGALLTIDTQRSRLRILPLRWPD